MKQILIALSCILVGQGLSAEEFKDFGRDRLNSSPRHGEWVDIKFGGRTVKAFVVYPRSEEHTSELQSRFDLVCRLLLEKKNKNTNNAMEDATGTVSKEVTRHVVVTFDGTNAPTVQLGSLHCLLHLDTHSVDSCQ